MTRLLGSDFSLIRQLQYFIPLFSIFINALRITNGTCVVPEADQQGTLRSLKNYEDVVVFHYNVPKHVLRATWQFTAFVNNEKCPNRKVDIFLKWGSYPVISINNATYPPYMFVEHNNTVKVSTVATFESKSIVIVPIYSPESGDWFVSAYSLHWDKAVHQKGLGQECTYSLSSIAIWSESTGIQNIPLGYQKTMRTSKMISYYKIYIPMDTWSFEVDIWGCNFTLKTRPNFQEPCINNLALEGRTLPFFNHSNPGPIGNLTSMDTYTFSEISPFQDSWYYLMVVSSSVISFNIKVTVFDCPVRTIEEIYIQQHGDTPIYFKVSNSLYLKDLKKQSIPRYSINQSYVQQNLMFSNIQQFNDLNDENNLDSCIPRYQLVRIKHAEPFSRDYLLRGQEWLTPWLALSDKYPIIIQFQILPLVDIGGTLNINLNLEMDKSLSKQQVYVVVCISRGRVPNQASGNVTCDNTHMMMRLSSTDMRNASLLIPYPQPDTWYIVLHANCYMNKIPIPCEMEQILISLKIKLQACVFEGSSSCGQNGICQEIHKGLLSYTACKCFKGHQGWGCTDASNSISEFSILVTTLVLTLSNLFFIPAIYLAFKQKLYAEGLIYFCTMLFSILYHACDQQFTACITKFEVLQYCDFFLGILAFWVTLVAMAEIPVQYISFCHMLGAIIITFQIESDKTSLTNISIPMIIGILIPLTSYGYYCYKIRKITWPKRMIQLIIGLSLAGLGILLFSLVETESNYQYVHSLWHAIIAISLIFLLLRIRKNEILRSRYTNELNNKDSPDNSVFNIDDSQQISHLIMDIT